MCGPPPEEGIVVSKKGEIGEEGFRVRIWTTGFADAIDDYKFKLIKKPENLDVSEASKAKISNWTLYNLNPIGGNFDWGVECEGKFYASENIGSWLREEFEGDPYEGFEYLGSLYVEDFEEESEKVED